MSEPPPPRERVLHTAQPRTAAWESVSNKNLVPSSITRAPNCIGESWSGSTMDSTDPARVRAVVSYSMHGSTRSTDTVAQQRTSVR